MNEESGAKKLNFKYIGPFDISEKITNVIFQLNPFQLLIYRKIHNVFHTSLLKFDKENVLERKKSPSLQVVVATQAPRYDVKKFLSERI